MAAGSEIVIPDEPPSAHTLRVAAEGLLLVLVACSPWPLGSRPPRWEFVLSVGVLGFALLWAAHAVVTRRFAYRSDPISLCLLGLILLTAFQLVPLPEPVVRVLSPTAVHWQRTLIPDVPELLPGEADAPQRSRWVRLSVAPSRTEDLLTQLLAVFVVYAGVRNFIATDRSLRRLAWVGFATGLLLALLGVSQFLAGPRLGPLNPPAEAGPGFGPFVNKNHFAFQVLLFAGLSVGLFLQAARREGVESPPAIGVLLGLGLMLGAVGFSQSRGGVVAAIVAAIVTAGVARWAGRERTGRGGAGLALAAGAGLVAIGLIAAFGGKVVTDRVSTIWGGAIDTRAAGWRSVRPLIEAFPVFGVGGGALARAEPVVRTDPELRVEFNTLDNEYLEAAVEGGLIRFALTIGLAVAAVGLSVTAYRRRRPESVGPLLLGCVFALTAVAVHSAGDYGLHVPSVAVAAAAIAGHVAAVRRGNRRPGTGRTPPLTGPAAYLAAATVFVVALAVTLAEWRAYRVDRLRTAALVLRVRAPELTDEAIRYLEAAIRMRPNDDAAWQHLLSTRLGVIGEQWELPGQDEAGQPAGDREAHVLAALRTARATRAVQPLYPAPHLVLGSYADRFARAEPPAVHFARARMVAGFDAEVWLVTGHAAALHGDWAGALADWREALVRAPHRLGQVMGWVVGRLPPERIRAELLPDDPEMWFAATPFLYPDTDDPARRAWVQTAADRWAAGPEPETLAGLTRWATALEELGDADAALRVWRRAVERFPDEIAPRNRLAARLEAEEEYEAAIPVLEWLIDRDPGTRRYTERLAAARHALKLKADIDRR
jgi:tetratricopeptide (TPR) repeat protein